MGKYTASYTTVMRCRERITALCPPSPSFPALDIASFFDGVYFYMKRQRREIRSCRRLEEVR
jgi:hypothetical protein